jgi:hypothetical protein
MTSDAGRESTAADVPNAALLQKLDALLKDGKSDDVLGFYTVMLVMSAAVGIAESIKKGNAKASDPPWVAVEQKVRAFTGDVVPLLEKAFPAYAGSLENSPLAAMARVAMKVLFEYLQEPGMAMTPYLSTKMMKWSRQITGAGMKESHRQIEEALHNFLDALLDLPK